MSRSDTASVRSRWSSIVGIGLLSLSFLACTDGGTVRGQSIDQEATPEATQFVELVAVQAETPVPSPPTATPSPTPPPPTPTPTPAPPTISLPPGEIERGNRERREMALTFDCGASGIPTPAILEALRNEGVRSTFFLTGQWVQQYPELSRVIASEHELANHSFTHPDFATLSDQRIVDEMHRAERMIQDTTGVATYPLWRAPFGSRNARILRVVAEAGWPYEIFWSADSGDWREITPQQVRTNINNAAINGAIIVQHCGSTQTATILGQVIADLKAKGFKLTTVTDLLRD